MFLDRSDVEKQLMRTVASPKLRSFLLKNVYWRDKHSLDWRLNLTVLRDSLPLTYQEAGDGSKFNGPALFIRGGSSDYILDEDLDGIYEKFPRALLSTIPNTSHWVHADAPEEFLNVVLEFILPQST